MENNQRQAVKKDADENLLKEIEMPISNWFAMCENNIYAFAKNQMLQAGIPIDLQCFVIKCVNSRFQQDFINQLINRNAELLLNGKEVQQHGDSDR